MLRFKTLGSMQNKLYLTLLLDFSWAVALWFKRFVKCDILWHQCVIVTRPLSVQWLVSSLTNQREGYWCVTTLANGRLRLLKQQWATLHREVSDSNKHLLWKKVKDRYASDFVVSEVSDTNLVLFIMAFGCFFAISKTYFILIFWWIASAANG